MARARTDTTTTRPPRLSWDEVRDHLKAEWEPGQHFSVLAPTGYGKSYLVTRGLLPLWSHTLILDAKGGDDTLARAGHERRKAYPSRFELWTRAQDERPVRYRIAPGGYSRSLRPAWHDVFANIWRAGNGRDASWTVYVDETRLMSDPKMLGMSGWLDALWISGRSRGITLVAGTQGPRWVPTSFYDQPRWLAIGQFRDKGTLRRIAEIGGDTSMLMDEVPRLGWHDFLFLGPRWSAIAKLPGRSTSS